MIFLPIFTLFLLFSLGKFPNFLNKFAGRISTILAFVFLLFCLFLDNISKPITFSLLPISPGFGFVWLAAENQKFWLSLIAIFWFLTALYSSQFFQKNNPEKSNQFHFLFLPIIANLIFLCLSYNLFSALFCYQILTLFLAFFMANFTTKNNQQSAKNFTFINLFLATILSIVVALTFKINGGLDLNYDGIFDIDLTKKFSQINYFKYGFLLCFYLLTVAFIAFFPIYLFFTKIHYLNPLAIIVGVFVLALAIIIFLFKLIFFVFGQKLFITLFHYLDYKNLIIGVLTLNLLVSGLMAVFSKNLKQIIIFLFFNQLIFLLIEFFYFNPNQKQSQIAIVSFFLNQLLIFFCVGNIGLYLKQSTDKSLNGIFYKLKITIFMLIFALINLCGLTPSISMLEKYWLIKNTIQNQSFIGFGILLLNLILCFCCLIKIVYPLIEISSKHNSPENYQIAKKIERSWSFILPIIILPLIIFFLAFPLVINFF